MKNGIKVIFSSIMGILYIAFGFIQIASVLFPGLADRVSMYAIPADLLGGGVLCVIGLVFLAGVHGLESGEPGGGAYLFVGILLSLGFGLIALLTLCAGWLEAALFGDPEEWYASALVVPMLYLALGSVAGYAAWGRRFFRGIARA